METLQQAADFAVKKIVQQGGQCMFSHDDDEKPLCAYSDGKGNHCAVGWLLDHDCAELMTYKGSIQSIHDIYLYTNKDFPIPQLILDEIYFFSMLQDFHDEKTARNRKKVLEEMVENYSEFVDFSNPNWQQWVNMGDDDDK